MYHHIIRNTISAILFFTSISISQQMKIMTDGDAAFVPEIKSIVEYADNKLTISTITNSSNNSEIDIKNNDEILYINGKRVKSLETFSKQYEGTEIGKEVKLGIKRKEQMLISSFVKQDPSKFKHKIMRVEGDPSENSSGDQEIKKDQVIMKREQQKIDSPNAEVQIKSKSTKK